MNYIIQGKANANYVCVCMYVCMYVYDINAK